MKEPLLIGIGGSHSGSGKTTLATRILRHFTHHPDPRTSTMLKKWGAIKYTRTASHPEIITDSEILMEKGKDTWKMLTSGASKVVWVRSPRSRLAEVMPGAVKRLSDLDGVIVEGNSAIEFLKPDIVVLIFGKGKELWKPGTERFALGADIILYDTEAELPARVKGKKLFHRDLSTTQEQKEFLDTIAELSYERGTQKGAAQKGG
jgi:molybdopterin-guanine dinucleotide biosynthesis protein